MPRSRMREVDKSHKAILVLYTCIVSCSWLEQAPPRARCRVHPICVPVDQLPADQGATPGMHPPPLGHVPGVACTLPILISITSAKRRTIIARTCRSASDYHCLWDAPTRKQAMHVKNSHVPTMQPWTRGAPRKSRNAEHNVLRAPNYSQPATLFSFAALQASCALGHHT